MSTEFKVIDWQKNRLVLIDQRFLPHEENLFECNSLEDTYNAIKLMVTRGAPLIGFTAIFGLSLYLKKNCNVSLDKFIERANYLSTSRPTAVNLKFECDRCIKIAQNEWRVKDNLDDLSEKLSDFGLDQMRKLENHNLKMAKDAEMELMAKLGNGPYRIMTICNTGKLACGVQGTALGVISYLHSVGKIKYVYASETRPYLQGSRLSAFELSKEGIPFSVSVEGASSYLLENNLVDAIFIGADRVVENGDTANKIGSSSLAIVAKYYDIPFYVVAPTSSFDLSLTTGKEIEIELRPEVEITQIGEHLISPKNTKAINPSFDVTSAQNIEAIFCENGKIKPVSKEKILNVVNV